jgi:hypothetical protein
MDSETIKLLVILIVLIALIIKFPGLIYWLLIGLLFCL